MRRDLGMRRGKECSQAAHASMAFLTRQLSKKGKIVLKDLSDPVQNWLNKSFTKITCKVNSEKELLEIYQKAIDNGVIASLITDSGRTEFGGVPTKTCIAIGPDWAKNIDPICSELALY